MKSERSKRIKRGGNKRIKNGGTTDDDMRSHLGYLKGWPKALRLRASLE